MNAVVDFLNLAGNYWAAWMLAASVDATALFLLVGLVWLTIRRRVAPQVGYWLFLMVVLKLLSPISLPVPESLARFVPSRAMTPSRQGGAVDQAMPPVAAATQRTDDPINRNASRPAGSINASQANQAAPVAVAMDASRGTVARTQLTLAATLMIVWLLAAGYLLVATLIRQRRFHRRVLAMPPIDPATLKIDLPELCRQSGVTKNIRLLESDLLDSPAAWGILRPTIILPREMSRSLSAEELQWVLLHELAHVRRRDLAMAAVQRCAAVLYFFHPVVWIANRVIDRLREDACDDLAVSHSGNMGVEPAEVFLRVLRFANRGRAVSGALGIFGLGSRAACFRRVRRLLDANRPMRTRLSPWAVCALLAVAAATLPYLRADDDAAEPSEQASKDKAVAGDQPNTPDRADDDKPVFELQVVGPDGKPVPHAEVEFRTAPKPTAGQFLTGEFIKLGSFGTFAKADASGTVRMARMASQRSFEIFIEIPGYGPYWATWSSSSHQEKVPSRFTAELDAGWSVGGVVVGDDGTPLAGARVRPSIEFKKRPGVERQLAVGTRIQTDAAGRWRFDSVPASMPHVFVDFDHADYSPLGRRLTRGEFGIQAGGEPAATIALARGLSITGRITDESGKPISGALVRTKFFNDLREATSGDDGAYRLIGCEPNVTRVVVWAVGRALEMKEVAVAPDMAPVDFQLCQGGHVRIRMLDERGNPVPKARVFFQRWHGPIKYFEFGHVNQYADLDGVWEWNEAPLDEFAADLCRPDGMQLSEQRLQARKDEYVFKLPPALVVSGNVIDAETKRPIARFRVVPGTRSEDSDFFWDRGDQFIANDGHYSVRRTHGYFAHLVRLEADGYQPGVSRDIKSDEGEITIDFALKKGVNVTARVLTPDGRPAAGAQVAFGIAGSQIGIKNGRIDDRSTYCARQETNDAGVFDFPPQDGEFQLVILHASGFAHVKVAPDSLPQTIPLQRWARVAGTFRVGKQPTANVPVMILSNVRLSYGDGMPNIFTHYGVTTATDGGFVFDRVLPGRAHIGRDLRLTPIEGAREAVSACLVPADFPGGETTLINLGGVGRRVIGRLRPPAGDDGTALWSFAHIRVEPAAEDDGRQRRLSCEATVDREGNFHLDDLPPDDYQLSVRFYQEPAGHLFDYRFRVPKAKNGAEEPIDLGDLTLAKE
ncbi:MAG TPA: M56 family metallopeptidase [Pirellulales bacterium]